MPVGRFGTHLEPNAPFFEHETDDAALIEEIGRLADDEHGRCRPAWHERREPLSSRHEQDVAERRCAVNDARDDRSTLYRFAFDEIVERSAERIRPRDANG